MTGRNQTASGARKEKDDTRKDKEASTQNEKEANRQKEKEASTHKEEEEITNTRCSVCCDYPVRS